MVAASEVRKICDLMRWRYRALGEKIRSCEILLNQWLGKKASWDLYWRSSKRISSRSDSVIQMRLFAVVDGKCSFRRRLPCRNTTSQNEEKNRVAMCRYGVFVMLSWEAGTFVVGICGRVYLLHQTKTQPRPSNLTRHSRSILVLHYKSYCVVVDISNVRRYMEILHQSSMVSKHRLGYTTESEGFNWVTGSRACYQNVTCFLERPRCPLRASIHGYLNGQWTCTIKEITLCICTYEPESSGMMEWYRRAQQERVEIVELP